MSPQNPETRMSYKVKLPLYLTWSALKKKLGWPYGRTHTGRLMFDPSYAHNRIHTGGGAVAQTDITLARKLFASSQGQKPEAIARAPALLAGPPSHWRSASLRLLINRLPERRFDLTSLFRAAAVQSRWGRT